MKKLLPVIALLVFCIGGCTKTENPADSGANNTAGGMPQMTGSPTLSRSSVKAGESFEATVPVTSNADRVTVLRGHIANGYAITTYWSILTGSASNPNGATSVAVNVDVPADTPPGQYFIAVQVKNSTGEKLYASYGLIPFVSQQNYSKVEGPSGPNVATNYPVTYITVTE